jgi:predicted nucleotidyltransferase component of viral defense system
MLRLTDLRKVAARSGARDISKVEIDIILTYLLQLFVEKEITKHVAFKGGTMLRKMVFGARGRLSTDLDFTARTEISRDDVMTMMLDALAKPYNERGVNIKLQVNLRERPILPVLPVLQLDQEYFKLLEFKPAAIPSLAIEEAIAEKIRDLYDLSEIAGRNLNRALVRPLAVLKLWNSGARDSTTGVLSSASRAAVTTISPT